MKIQRIAFLNALERCLPGVDTRDDTFRLSYDSITAATSLMSISVPFKFEDEIDVSVKATDLYQLIKKFTVDEIDITSTDTALLIKAGKAKAKLSLLLKKTSTQWPMILPESYAKLAGNFFEILEACYIPSNNAVMAGIYVEQCNMYSTDKAKVNNGYLIGGDMPTFWINDTIAKVLLKYSDAALFTVQKGCVAFKTLDGVVIMCKRLNDEQYPINTLHKYLAFDDGTGDFFDLPSDLSEAIKRASPLAEKSENATYITLKFAPDGITVTAGKNSGEYEEFVEGACPIEDTVMLNYKHVMYGLSRATRARIASQEHNGETVKVLILSSTTSMHILLIAR